MEIIFSSLLQYRASAHPHRISYIFEGKQFTYREYYMQSVKTAKYLQSLGLKKGDRIGLLDLNTPQSVHFISGAMLLGIIPVSMNWRAMPQEINFVLQDAGIKHFFHGAAFAKLIENLPQSSVEIHKIEDALPEVEEMNFAETITPDDTCVILYTSGTTGNPKGVLITYKNMYSCYQLCAWDTPSFGPDGRNLVCGPLYSIFGFGAFFACIYAGATNVLVRLFEPNIVAKTIAETKITNALLVPIMIKMLCMVDGIEKYDFSSLKHIQYGGSPVSTDTLQKAHQIFNCYFTQVYGLTESAGVGCSLRFDDHAKILSSTNSDDKKLLLSAGKASLGIEIKIADDDRNFLPCNSPGEVLIKGENIASGYWNAPEENNKMFNNDGWLHTGDIGYFDEEGYLFLVDRKNDKIVSKGVNIFPAEIERVIEQHPNIKEVAVVAVPDEKAGEAVCAVVVLKEGMLELSEFQNWCKGKMPDYKIPKHLAIKTELPRNPTGKILRRLIREPYWKDEERNIKG
ncbi:MAG: AMP-binding protein [Bacteroidetes bacterium]|nr:AMP-binding protein [Bacteroidota bacterium]